MQTEGAVSTTPLSLFLSLEAAGEKEEGAIFGNFPLFIHLVTGLKFDLSSRREGGREEKAALIQTGGGGQGRHSVISGKRREGKSFFL